MTEGYQAESIPGEGTPWQEDDSLSLPATAVGPHGPITIHRMDCRRRLPVAEAWVAEVEGIAARVYAVAAHYTPDGQLLGAMIQPDRAGQPLVFVNLVRGFCPVLRIGLIGHEAEHWRRGDCTAASPFAHDAQAEAACDRVADQRIAEACLLVELKSPDAAPVDAALCCQCYREGSRTCRQPAGTFERIRQALRLY